MNATSILTNTIPTWSNEPKNPITLKFHEKLALLRGRLSLTKKELSEKVGISEAAICHHEKGVVAPSIEFMLVYCEFYGVTPNDLLLNK